MDSELRQIWDGPANEACSILDCLKYMPPGGGSDQLRHLPRQPEGQHQLDVFLYRSKDGAVEQKVADFIRWMEDRSDVKSYMWIVNLVQLWVPVSTGGDANDETILSASEQPFGVGRLSNGICRYRFCSTLCDRKACPSGGPDLINTVFATGEPLYEHYQQHHHHRHQYGIQARWALPLVHPTTGVRIGTLEFVTMNKYHTETRCFLNFGPKYYEQFCIDVRGKNVESGQYLDQQYSSQPHLLAQEDDIFAQFPTQQNMGHFEIGGTSGNANSCWPSTMYDVSNGLLGNANEDDANSANGFAATQQNMGHFEIGESSGTGNAIEDPRANYDGKALDFVAEDAAQENIGGVTNDLIEHTTQRTSPPATSSNSRRPSLVQLQRYIGRPLQEVADIFRVNRSTIKRWCRRYGMPEWPSSKKRKKATKKSMIVKAAYGDINVRVRNFDSGKDFEWLSKELGDKLKLQVGSFSVQYKGDTGDPVTISGTEHLMRRLDSLHSSNMKIMYLIVSPYPTS